MEHVEEAGIHSGDSSCVLPSITLSKEVLATIEEYTAKLARALHVIGLMNVQYAVQKGVVYVLEVNPRASRTVPYVSKATGIALPKAAVALMLGRKLRDIGELTGGKHSGVLEVSKYFVKSPVFPFNKFPGVDPALGPEMRSTGEVMGVGENFGEAFGKAQLSAGTPLPESGSIFISVTDTDKAAALGSGQAVRGTRISNHRHARNRGADPGRGNTLQDRVQSERRPSERGGSDEGGLRPPGDLYAHQRRDIFQRRARYPPHGSGMACADYHHHERCSSRRRSRRVPPPRSRPRVEPAGDSPHRTRGLDCGTLKAVEEVRT